MVRLTDIEVKELVRERYSEVAKGASDCCGASCCSTETALYTLQEIDGLPDEALMASAGCGNPTAIGALNAGETVADFGSGGGIDCFLAARAVGVEGRVIGVDMTPDMVELARSNAVKLGLPNVEFHLSEMESTPIEDASVGCAHIQLRHKSRPRQGRGVPGGVQNTPARGTRLYIRYAAGEGAAGSGPRRT